jgi:hypothetical protein
MFRTAVFLLFLGLALGLWLGFNPRAHSEMVRSWDQMRAAYVRFKDSASLAIHNWSAGSKASQPSGSSSLDSAWKQLSADLAAVWHSVENLWSQVTARWNINKS